MRLGPSSLFRLPSLMLAASGAAACGGLPDAGTGPAGISLAIDPDSGSVQQSNSTLVQATVTRSGEFTGPVTFRVSGMPSGASATVSIPQTSGSITSAGPSAPTPRRRRDSIIWS